MYQAVGTAAGSVWILCGSEPGAGGQAHQLYVSTDHGRGFSLRNGRRFLQRDEIGHGLNGSGYGAQHIVAISTQTAFVNLVGINGTLLRTDDGGRSWRPLTGFPAGDHSGLGIPSTSTDGTDIWEPVLQIGVFASADSGHHWHDALR